MLSMRRVLLYIVVWPLLGYFPFGLVRFGLIRHAPREKNNIAIYLIIKLASLTTLLLLATIAYILIYLYTCVRAIHNTMLPTMRS